MLEQVGTFLDKARESVTGARVEYEGGRYNNSANRSYYAVFQAGIHALIMDGVRRQSGGTEWGHAFVEAQFVGLLINRNYTPTRDGTTPHSKKLELRGTAK